MTGTMFAFYFVGYVAVASLFYYRAYRTAPVMDESEMPMLTLWVNPDLDEQPEIWRKAA